MSADKLLLDKRRRLIAALDSEAQRHIGRGTHSAEWMTVQFMMLAAASMLRDPECSGDGGSVSELLDKLIEAMTDACDEQSSGHHQQAAMRRVDAFKEQIIARFSVASATEDRVGNYILSIQDEIGYGDDPVGFLIASHAALRAKLYGTTAAGSVTVKPVSNIEGPAKSNIAPEAARILIGPGDVEEHAGMLVVTNIEVRKALLAPSSPQRYETKGPK